MGLGYGNMFPPSRQLVNYDYFDIANGTGYDVYYGAKGASGANVITTIQGVYSEWPHTDSMEQQISGQVFLKWISEDFNILFNRPRNIKGKLISNIPLGMQYLDTDSAHLSSYAVVEAKHYDGTTETSLGSGASVVFHHYFPINFGVYSDMAIAEIDIDNKAHFKKGDTLKLTVEGWFRTGYKAAWKGNIMAVGIGHDPIGREDFKFYISGGAADLSGSTRHQVISGSTCSTTMSFHVPFVLDV